MESIEFDICGQVCPSTLLIALKEITDHADDIRSGKVKLIFRLDHRDAVMTIPESATNMGYVVNVQKRPGHYEIEVTI